MLRPILFGTALAAALSQGAAAAPVLTQDEAAFATATAGLTFTTENFDALPDEFGVASKDFGPFTLTSTGGGFSIVPSGFCRSGKCASSFVTGMTLSFDAPISALGFYLGDGDGFGSAVEVNGAGIGSISTPSSGYTFVGIYDPVGTFTSIALPGNLGVFDIDDVSYEAPAAVPLPASLPLLAGAMFVLGLTRRRPRCRLT
jgi:hypothetical protein